MNSTYCQILGRRALDDGVRESEFERERDDVTPHVGTTIRHWEYINNLTKLNPESKTQEKPVVLDITKIMLLKMKMDVPTESCYFLPYTLRYLTSRTYQTIKGK